MSALPMDYAESEAARILGGLRSDSSSQDVDMADAGPATAPLQQSSTFFHD